MSDPILFFNFVDDNKQQFRFDDAMPGIPAIVVLDEHQVAGGRDGVNNFIVNSGTGNNTADSGFTLQLSGNYTQVAFDLYDPGTSSAFPQSVGFSVATQSAAVPEPSTYLLLSLPLLACGLVKARKKMLLSHLAQG